MEIQVGRERREDEESYQKLEVYKVCAKKGEAVADDAQEREWRAEERSMRRKMLP